jgi:hypothetical protein
MGIASGGDNGDDVGNCVVHSSVRRRPGAYRSEDSREGIKGVAAWIEDGRHVELVSRPILVSFRSIHCFFEMLEMKVEAMYAGPSIVVLCSETICRVSDAVRLDVLSCIDVTLSQAPCFYVVFSL